MPGPKKNNKIAPKKDYTPLEEFVKARKRSVVFLCIPEFLNVHDVLTLRKELGNRHFEEFDIVIQSGGGDIHSAYQMIELLRFHATKLNACVPFYAKSAATLLCVGANVIIVDELAQLGPLDTQVEERGRGGKRQHVSALNPFKALEKMQGFALETLDLAMKMIVRRSRLDLDECFKHGIEFVKVTTTPLMSQLSPEKMGEYSRALSIGEEYAKRLLKHCYNWDDDKRREVASTLVHGYPSHDYIIDYRELQDIGFNVELFKEEEQNAVQGLFEYLIKEGLIIKLIEYKPEESKKE
jgi:hypothetical protein